MLHEYREVMTPEGPHCELCRLPPTFCMGVRPVDTSVFTFTPEATMFYPLHDVVGPQYRDAAQAAFYRGWAAYDASLASASLIRQSRDRAFELIQLERWWGL